MKKLYSCLIDPFTDLARQFRISYIPPLMIYVAAGVSGLTGIVGTFFVKDYLNLSAALLAGLGFWAGIPWVLKMPLGHLVDLIWKRKNYLVFLTYFQRYKCSKILSMDVNNDANNIMRELRPTRRRAVYLSGIESDRRRS